MKTVNFGFISNMINRITRHFSSSRGAGSLEKEEEKKKSAGIPLKRKKDPKLLIDVAGRVEGVDSG